MVERKRRFVGVLIILVFVTLSLFFNTTNTKDAGTATSLLGESSSLSQRTVNNTTLAVDALATLPVKGRAPRSGYSREQFGGEWATLDNCDVRNLVLQRDLADVELADNNCDVESGILRTDPYTGSSISFVRGPTTSQAIQIDHVVAVSDAWQKGAQSISILERKEFYNDSLNLLAVDGPTNIDKSDADAATWLPPNKSYRCRYVARQISVKIKYRLWVTEAEHNAMLRVLRSCPGQVLPITEPTAYEKNDQKAGRSST